MEGKYINPRNLLRLMERPAALQERVFTRLFEQAEIAKLTPDERFDYEESVKVYRDLINVVRTAKQKGHRAGLEEGLEKGRAEGLEKGRAEGVLQAKIEDAMKMKRKGFSDNDIAVITGLSLEEVSQI